MSRRLTIAILLALLVVPAEAGKEKPAPRTERHFDHERHAAALKAAKGGTEGCAGRCHQAQASGAWVDNGKKEHGRCFDACHHFETSCSNLEHDGGKVCITCHVNLKAKCVPAAFGGQNRVRQDDFVATYSHRKHIAPDAPSGKQCEGCHGQFGEGAPKTQGALAIGHAQCSGCHERGMEPFMTQCASCHVDAKSAAGRVPVVAARGPNPYAVTGAFDHVRHASARRVGTEGKACLTCHANIKDAADDTTIPLPTMQGCYKSCHNGDNAFSATGTSCTKCHKGGRP